MINKLRKDKRGLSIESTAISVIMFSFVVVGFWSVYASTTTQYGNPVNESFAEAFDKINDTNALGTQIAEKITNPEAKVTNFIVTYLASGISAFTIMLNIIPITTSLFYQVALFLGIRNLAIQAFLAIFVIAVIFAVVRILTKSTT